VAQGKKSLIPESVPTSGPLSARAEGLAPGEGFVRFLKHRRFPLLVLLGIALFCEAAWLVFLTPNEADLLHYECYGVTFWLGSQGSALLPHDACAYLFQGDPTPPPTSPLPFRMLPIEYPPLTILLFSLPLLAPLPFYALAFALMMTLVAGLLYLLLARSGAGRAAPLFLLYLLLGAAGVFQERFDLLPAACTLLCLLAAERGRWRAAYVALALGALLKIYPIVMLPALFLAEQHARTAQTEQTGEQHAGLLQTEQVRVHQSGIVRAWTKMRRWRWSNCLLCVGLLLAVTGGFALLNVQDALISPLRYFLARPVQIEALAGSVIWFAGHFGIPYTIDFTFGSLNLESELSRLLSPLDTLLMLAGILFLLWLQLRRRIDLAQALVGLVCLLMATGKVFSPQYLLWLIPLLAYLYARGKTSRAWMSCWAAISLLTTCIYIFYYAHLVDPRLDAQIVQTLPGFFELVLLRNLLLLGATIVFLGGWWGVRRDASAHQ
jgi:hypothetical protein